MTVSSWPNLLALQGEHSVYGLHFEASVWLTWNWARQHSQDACLIVPSMKRLYETNEFLHCFNSTLSDPVEFTLFPELDMKYHLQLSPDGERYVWRQRTLWRLQSSSNKSRIIVTTPWALAQQVSAPSDLSANVFELAKGEELDRALLRDTLIEWGYDSASVIEGPGQYSFRGFTLDLYPPLLDHPVRVELFDTTIESIKTFNLETQRTIQNLSSCTVIPYRPILMNQKTAEFSRQEIKHYCDIHDIPKPFRDRLNDYIENKVYFKGIDGLMPFFSPKCATLLDHLSPATQFFITDAQGGKTELEHLQMDFEKSIDALSKEVAALKPFHTSMELMAEWTRMLPKERTINVSPLGFDGRATTSLTLSESTERIKNRLNPPTPILFPELVSRFRMILEELLGQHFEIFVCLSGESQRTRVEHMLGGVVPGVHLLKEDIPRGFIAPQSHTVFLSEEELFGKRKRLTTKTSPTTLALDDLKPGDYVAHIDHGIARFDGLRRMSFGALDGDFLQLTFRDGDLLYLPVDRMSIISRFAGAQAEHVVLDKLGSNRWEKAKSKARQSAKDVAAQLMEHYAMRALSKGPPMKSADLELEPFESLFPYQETEDQLSCIEAIKKDFADGKPVDRLICGDVGFGKTEVAMRAAFLAVHSKYQCAVLVPTTLLCLQHEETFRNRFRNFPVRVASLSRFQSTAESAKIISKLKSGEIDIIIGTHRLLSSDVSFQSLGLLIVDEEQRFGVTHKERIRQLKQGVHTITLTATPIPRTLHLSFMGLRDLSLIRTPPTNRMAVRTYTCNYDAGILKEAIETELKRNGQVFVVRPKIQGIEEATAEIQSWVPHAKILWAHGQLSENELERRMIAFYRREVDILISTTIVESGLDVPNANTMIVQDSDHFGLAQLYQLRGRIGRSNLRAYCYLTVPSLNALTPDAKRRLHVLQTHSELGSGLTIAHYDLDLRGAGDILGDKQSGHVQAIGLDAYLELLNEAVASLKGEPQPAPEPDINIKAVAFLGDDYIPDVLVRMRLYRRLSSAQSLEEIDRLRDEIVDRFGPLLPEGQEMIVLSQCRHLSKSLQVVHISAGPQKLALRFSPSGIDRMGELLLNLVKENPKKYKALPDGRLAINIPEEVSSLGILFREMLGLWERHSRFIKALG